jgi:RalA-binding protein 1
MNFLTSCSFSTSFALDFVDPQERINELSQLIKSLPLANYSLLRALTAHLILIVQNSAINKMTMRNVGIVFSPTLGIPAGVFSLMLCEFNRVFHPDDPTEPQGQPQQTPRQSSYQHNLPPYSVDPPNWNNLVGVCVFIPLSRDSVHLSHLVSSEEVPSDSDDPFNTDESGTEATEFDQNMPAESSSSASPDSQGQLDRHKPTAADATPPTPKAPVSKASQTAANLRLNLTLTDETERHGRMLGLPVSPRPVHSPSGSSQELSTPSPIR